MLELAFALRSILMLLILTCGIVNSRIDTTEQGKQQDFSDER